MDLEEFLRRRGEKLIPSGREKRLERDHSITVRGREWYDHAAERGGGPISFVQNFYHLPYPEAVTLLLNGEHGQAYAAAAKKKKEPTEFVLPPAAPTMRQVFAYLVKTRGISREVLSDFAHAKLIYEDANYHNAVFVGYDEHGTARHAHKRSTSSGPNAFRQTVEGSDFRYAFYWQGEGDQLYVFEAPVDLLSYITLHSDAWQSHSYVACCGTSSLPVLGMLERAPQLKSVHLCLDNDKTGQKASHRMSNLIKTKGMDIDLILPKCKDWNEDLLALREEMLAVPDLCPGYSQQEMV